MTLVKKQYNGRELPVFENMDEATEYFSKARKTILWVMIIFSACYSFFVAVLLSFSYKIKKTALAALLRCLCELL